MPSRRLHHKSRHGCPQCKLRKVKCDEKKPECNNCLRNGKQCGFLELVKHGTVSCPDVVQPEVPDLSEDEYSIKGSSAYPSPISSPEGSSSRQADALTIEPLPPTLPSLSLQDYALLHHYATITTTSMSDVAELQQIWKSAVPREGIAHGFLRDIILSLAAAHLACICPSEQVLHLRRASTLRNKALQSAVPSLAAITPANCDALFAFAGIVALSVFAFPASSDTHSVPSPVDDILDVFSLVRGVGSLVRNGNALAWINHGDLQPLIEPRGRWPVAWQPEDIFLPDNVNVRLDDLEALHGTAYCNDEERQFYAKAIKALRSVFERFINNPDGRSSLFVWGAIVPDEYLVALKARKPLALIILAHYGVLAHQAKAWWWCGNKGAHLVEAISQQLPREWQTAIQWPMEATQGN